MQIRNPLSLAALAVSLSACAETPLLGPGPDMSTPERDAAFGGLPEGRSAVAAGLEVDRPDEGSGEPDASAEHDAGTD